ncbi:hypothetical protein [Paraburkholderia sp. GAS32]|uniref:hypothetical protein n=1 Tax=Paraburkholderia sp. GAS32 TaxID=3035129 RepID=UPI003D23173C
MLDNLPTAESARIRLTFREMRKLVQSFREGEASFQQAVDKLERVQAATSQSAASVGQASTEIERAVAKAIATLNQDSIWEERFKKLGDEVHFNGYVALAKLVDVHQMSAEARLKKMLLDAVAQVDLRINNLEAAVVGKPPLPALPLDATIGQRIRASATKTFVRFRRWCIDAMPPLVLIGVVLLLIGVLLLGTQIYFGHFTSR